MFNRLSLTPQWLHPKSLSELFLGDKNSKVWLSSLDGIRAIAVLLVFLAHGKRLFEAHFPQDGTFLGFYVNGSSLGRTGVYLFFVLSSFLLTSHLLKPHLNLAESKIWLNYILRRFLRVYPLYIFVLLVYLVFPSFKYTINNVINHLLLQEGFNHFWTIVVEFKYYLILPFLVCLLVFILKRSFTSSLLFLCTAIALLEGVNLLQEADITSPTAILPHLPIFLMGSLGAVIHEKLSKLSLETQQKIKPIMTVISLSSITILIFLIPNIWSRSLWDLWFVDDFVTLSPNHWIYTIHGLLWIIFLVTHIYSQDTIKTILSYPVLRFIGVISFGMYVWHIAVLGYIEAYLKAPSIIVFMTVLMFTILVSSMTYLTIERPFMKIKIKF